MELAAEKSSAFQEHENRLYGKYFSFGKNYNL